MKAGTATRIAPSAGEVAAITVESPDKTRSSSSIGNFLLVWVMVGTDVVRTTSAARVMTDRRERALRGATVLETVPQWIAQVPIANHEGRHLT